MLRGSVLLALVGLILVVFSGTLITAIIGQWHGGWARPGLSGRHECGR